MKVIIKSQVKRAYLIRGHYLKDRLWQPIIKDRPAKAIFKLKFEDCGNTKSATIQPQLVYGSKGQFGTMLPTKEISLEKKEQVHEFDFRPKESERHEIRLIFLNPPNCEIYDNYGVLFQARHYSNSFFVHTFFDYFLFWFAGLSTIGAVVEIINLLITAKIL